MSFVNNYTPKSEIQDNELYGPEPYDINCALPIPSVLSTDKVQLVPFVPRVHAAAYFDGIQGHESMLKYLPVPMEDPNDFLRLAEGFRRDSKACLFAVIDTTRPDPDHPEWKGSFAGVFGYVGIDRVNLVASIGPAIILPRSQRTHVASHALGLLLIYLFEFPPSGVGFRRVTWGAYPENVASNKLAERMGFKLEGLARWGLVVRASKGYEKPGKEARAGDGADGFLGVDRNTVWALCWDDWEESGRKAVEHAFARTA